MWPRFNYNFSNNQDRNHRGGRAETANNWQVSTQKQRPGTSWVFIVMLAADIFPGFSSHICSLGNYFLSAEKALPMIYISESEYAVFGPRLPPPSLAWLPAPPPHTPPPIFRFGGCRLLPLSSQQALKASPFTGGIINIICRYGNLHFSNLSLVTFYVVKFKIGSKGVGNHPKLIYQN